VLKYIDIYSLIVNVPLAKTYGLFTAYLMQINQRLDVKVR